MAIWGVKPFEKSGHLYLALLLKFRKYWYMTLGNLDEGGEHPEKKKKKRNEIFLCLFDAFLVLLLLFKLNSLNGCFVFFF